ncbi:MAG: TonB-dependent receptor [Bacteroidetes bacterium]|nr:MAG: TonB-dependent receptor [Bacteroidota bacterium]
MNYFRLFLILCFSSIALNLASAQTATLSGYVYDAAGPLAYATVGIEKLGTGTLTNDSGEFELKNIQPGTHEVSIRLLGYREVTMTYSFTAGMHKIIHLELEPEAVQSDDVVISGTLNPVSREKSAVAIEVYRPQFFLKNPTPSFFESLQIVNGVRPQVNCNICNTGDIHMNGLEGPYTMITIDGMPIVSGLASVYGLSGIPNALIERMEIVKGPASTLYGSEAVGGLINIITKMPYAKPFVSADVFSTSWNEHNLDLGAGYKTGKLRHILGVNLFYYNTPIDHNGDGFTDATLAKRLSLFHKTAWKTSGGTAQVAFRILGEKRWGGQLNFSDQWAGSDSVYGEQIDTRRFEVLGQVPFLIAKEQFRLQFSASSHFQDSWYGKLSYIGTQHIAFSQLLWNKKLNARHELSSGAAFRYTYYDDNTVATEDNEHQNQPSIIKLPGLFVQHSWDINSSHSLLSGIRYDYNSLHGSILSPRMNYKWAINKWTTWRLGAGNGYRVANVFTEDHAALTGARNVVFEESLKPEKSWNMNTHLLRFISLGKSILNLELSGFYTFFHNKIIPDYLSNTQEIRYANLDGHAVSQGISFSAEWAHAKSLRIQSGFTAMDVFQVNASGVKQRQLLTERFSATWTASYTFKKPSLSLDYSGNVYGPMLLPLLSEWDPRPESSPWYSIQNFQMTWKAKSGLELYGGIKNLLNFVPVANAIARAHDPFDKQVDFAPDGSVLRTANNPYALTFDPSYVYASNQGRRYYIGLRYRL